MLQYDSELLDLSVREMIIKKIEHHRELAILHIKAMKDAKKKLYAVDNPTLTKERPESAHFIIDGNRRMKTATKEMVLDYLEEQNDLKQNSDIVKHYYPNLSGDERAKLIWRFSVVLNSLKKEKKIIAQKVRGVKGNLYKINREIKEN